MPRTIFAALVAFVALARSTPIAHATDKDFTFVVSADPMKVGVRGAIVVKLDVLGGYHWNSDYPAKIEIVGAPDPLGLTKATLSQLAGDFKAQTPTAVLVSVPAEPKSAIDAPITVQTSFSVCNDRVCLMKKATAIVTVTAR